MRTPKICDYRCDRFPHFGYDFLGAEYPGPKKVELFNYGRIIQTPEG